MPDLGVLLFLHKEVFAAFEIGDRNLACMLAKEFNLPQRAPLDIPKHAD